MTRAIKKLHVKKGDVVMVVSGKDASTKGKVMTVFPKTGKIIVEGVSVATHHIKPRGMGQAGGRIEKETPIYASKVMLYCDHCKKPTRIGHRFLDDGKKVRVCKKCGETLDN